MTVVRVGDRATLIQADSLTVCDLLDEQSVDAIVCDPPYGLSFMGRQWDHGVPSADFWRAFLAVAKPGAHLVAFGGDRTHHRLMVAIEDAGWEIRTCIYWLFGTGFPKSLDIGKALGKAAGAERKIVGYDASRVRPNRKYKSGAIGNVGGEATRSVSDRSDNGATITVPATEAAKQWDGWGTALKPAAEIIILARKPLDGTVAENVTKWGTGGLNIDGCRIATAENPSGKRRAGKAPGREIGTWANDRRSAETFAALRAGESQGRWPANLILDEEAGARLDEQSEPKMHGAGVARDGATAKVADSYKASSYMMPANRNMRRLGDAGGASRFFYCAKASKRERGEGCDHPTVKPLALMRWLVRLVTPPDRGDGVFVLDPFMGSGTTGVAALAEGFDFIGIELDAHYMEIAERRLRKGRGEHERTEQATGVAGGDTVSADVRVDVRRADPGGGELGGGDRDAPGDVDHPTE